LVTLTCRRLLLGLALIGCAGLVLWAVILEPWRPRGPFWEKYQKVQLSMTEKEVKEILGPPILEEFGGGSLGPYCLAWFEGDQTIAVDFDLDGRVTEKRFRPGRHSGWVHEPVRESP